jgi:HSP20 family protein
MNLIPYRPFQQLDQFRRDMDQFWQNSFPSLFQEGGFGFPQMDIHETDTEVVATCNLPGIEKKEDIHIDVTGNVLSVSGQIQRTNEAKEDRFHRKERYYGSFHRSVTLPANVADEGIRAFYRNGVLEIRIPKAQEPQRKKIDIDFH